MSVRTSVIDPVLSGAQQAEQAEHSALQIESHYELVVKWSVKLSTPTHSRVPSNTPRGTNQIVPRPHDSHLAPNEKVAVGQLREFLHWRMPLRDLLPVHPFQR